LLLSSKATGVTLLVVLLVLDFYPLRRLRHGKNHSIAARHDPARPERHARPDRTGAGVLPGSDRNERTGQFIVYPREGLGFRELHHNLNRVRRYLAFFGKYLDNPPVTETEADMKSLAAPAP
jgi:hypothetical protein